MKKLSKKIKHFIQATEHGNALIVSRFKQKTVGDFFSSCFYYFVIIVLGIATLVTMGDLSGDLDGGGDAGGAGQGDDTSLDGIEEVGFQHDYSSPNRYTSTLLSETATAESVSLLSLSGIMKEEIHRSDKSGTRGFHIDNGEKRKKLFPLKNSSSVLSDILSCSEDVVRPVYFRFTSGYQYEIYKQKKHFRMRVLDEISVQSAKEILHSNGIQFTESDSKSTAILQWREKRGIKRLKEMILRILGITALAALLFFLSPILPITLPITIPLLLIIAAGLLLRELPYLYLALVSLVAGLRSSVTFTWDQDSVAYTYRKPNLLSKKHRLKRKDMIALFLDRKEWSSWSGEVGLTILLSRKEFSLPLIPKALNSSKWYERYTNEKVFLIGSALLKLIVSEWDSAETS